jgi:hypothetical protein
LLDKEAEYSACEAALVPVYDRRRGNAIGGNPEALPPPRP